MGGIFEATRAQGLRRGSVAETRRAVELASSYWWNIPQSHDTVV